jgi:hypothetical protein
VGVFNPADPAPSAPLDVACHIVLDDRTVVRRTVSVTPDRVKGRFGWQVAAELEKLDIAPRIDRATFDDPFGALSDWLALFADGKVQHVE